MQRTSYSTKQHKQGLIMYEIKYMDDKPYTVSLGLRTIPNGSTKVIHPDGTAVYLVPQVSVRNANEMLALQSKLDKAKNSVKYLQYAYVEYVLDISDPDMFLMIMEDFGEWHKHIQY